MEYHFHNNVFINHLKLRIVFSIGLDWEQFIFHHVSTVAQKGQTKLQPPKGTF